MADSYKKYETTDTGDVSDTAPTPAPDAGNNPSTDTIPMSDRQSPWQPAEGSESDTLTGNDSGSESAADTGGNEGSAQEDNEPEVRNV